MDEQLALHNLIGLSDEDFAKMRKVEDEIISNSKKYFKEKSKKFEEFLAGRTIREAVLELEEKNFELSKDNVIEMRISNKLDSETELKGKVKKSSK
jgi:tRNA splicing ligase